MSYRNKILYNVKIKQKMKIYAKETILMENVTLKKKKFDWSQFTFLCVILAVPIINFLIFWLYVNFSSILMAFQFKTPNGLVWGFHNFTKFFNEMSNANSSELGIALKNTMLYFGTNLLITLPVSLLLCYFFYKKIAGYKFFRFVFYLPSIIAASVYVELFKYLIASNGLLGQLVAMSGGHLDSLLMNASTSTATILFYTIMISFGGNIILLGGAMNHIDSGIIEAAKIDGANMVTEIVRIILPLVWPTLSTLIIFAFVGMFGASGPILLFLNDKATEMDANTLSFWIYWQVYRTGEHYYPSAVGLVMTAVGFPIAMLVRYGLNKILDAVEM